MIWNTYNCVWLCICLALCSRGVFSLRIALCVPQPKDISTPYLLYFIYYCYYNCWSLIKIHCFIYCLSIIIDLIIIIILFHIYIIISIILSNHFSNNSLISCFNIAIQLNITLCKRFRDSRNKTATCVKLRNFLYFYSN